MELSGSYPLLYFVIIAGVSVPEHLVADGPLDVLWEGVAVDLARDSPLGLLLGIAILTLQLGGICNHTSINNSTRPASQHH